MRRALTKDFAGDSPVFGVSDTGERGLKSQELTRKITVADKVGPQEYYC